MKSVFLLLVLSCFSAGSVAEMWVEKQRFTTHNFATFGGKTIAQVDVGWESYGTLNADKSNAVLITHYFSATSHAAGKYSADDPAPGYWDALIGPGKAIDTERFFVISVDTLVNLNAYDPNVVTTGPASLNPKTGQPYGLSFPVVTIRDMVNVQKLVLESLGITELYAVVGPSMGSMQAIDWAAAYPDKVARMVSVIGSAGADPWTVSFLEQWTMPIRLDPAWQKGNYTPGKGPAEGLTQSLMLITQSALTPAYFKQVGRSDAVGFAPLESAPLNSIHERHSIVNWLYQRAQQRSRLMDANHLLYLVRANQLFISGHGGSLVEGLKRIQAKTLFLPATQDLLLMPYLSETAHNLLIAAGNDSKLHPLPGDLGHFEGIANTPAFAEKLRQFLAPQQGD